MGISNNTGASSGGIDDLLTGGIQTSGSTVEAQNSLLDILTEQPIKTVDVSNLLETLDLGSSLC